MTLSRAAARQRPVIGVPACIKEVEGHPFHAVGDKYLRAAAEGADALPLVVPALGRAIDVDTVLSMVDGLLVTGSTSNVHPDLYGGPQSREGVKHDAARDATTLPLIRRAAELGVPLLAICRGLQEMNVAFGGSLHQHVHELPGKLDHRDDKSLPVAERYGPAHEVALAEGGRLRALAGAARITVNSLHHQAIDRLGEGLAVEARADDGVIEAVRIEDAPGFTIGVQWHPEADFRHNPTSARLFEAFGAACRDRRAQREQGLLLEKE